MTEFLFTSLLERLIKTSIVLFCHKNNNQHTHTFEHYWKLHLVILATEGNKGGAEGLEKNKDRWDSLTGLTQTKYCFTLHISKFRSKLIMWLCRGSTRHKLVEWAGGVRGGRFGCSDMGRYFFSANTENKSTFKGWGDSSATAICIECRIDCSTSFSMWVINEGRGWDVMINSR